MKDTIKRLRELEAAATAGPWAGVPRCGYGYVTSEYSQIAEMYGNGGYTNAQLVAEMRNALLDLLDRQEKLEAVAEAAKTLWDFTPTLIYERKLMDALAALEDK